ncbi:hypothetical protein NQ315_016528 [Exocentrus adspersus]|uniref:Alpha-and gamma-adaptin-binding protein p34 n=1 Tax=Exocentrus adspersus TaxID=1586481 RepID=A0AAV8VZV7_9CUCU|nr:hypothetical protein NQ315_016528 [Exocentrus adspersus]
MDNKNIPSIVVVSCSHTKPKSLIKLITKEDTVNVIEDQGLVKQSWLIDTKYYTAEVQILGLEQNYIRTEEFNKNVEALIIHMDSNKPSGLDDILHWKDLEKDCNLEIKLLISNYCTEDTKVTKTKATEWCLKHGFEFVELYPMVNSSPEEEIIKEKFGVDRIIEALQTHTWPNLVMKNKSKTSKGCLTKPNLSEQTNSDMDNSLKSDATDDFTELFSQLHMMKESLQTMPMSQRTQCAEQMVTAFWKAIGGEEEEILDL